MAERWKLMVGCWTFGFPVRRSRSSTGDGSLILHPSPLILSPSAFTLIEITMAVAVIAFALVAIAGLLPLGIETQRDNRQNTIVNQDGTYLLEALRGGPRFDNELVSLLDLTQRFSFTNDADIIRYLTRVGVNELTNMRSICGSAALRGATVQDFAMHYRVRSEVRPVTTDSNLFYGTQLDANLYEMRLTLFWPLKGNGEVSDTPHRQSFRTLASGQYDTNGNLFFGNTTP